MEAELHAVAGTVLWMPEVASPQLHNRRNLFVYLPPSYMWQPTKRYPVVYMHDGQNLFDDALSFAGEWGVDETLESLSHEGIEAIAVGIANQGAGRLDEYSPFRDVRGRGGRGDAYLAFIMRTVKPLIDREFRTLPGRANTGLLGSSMGGLISLYGFFRHPEVFGFAGAMSPSLWFAGRAIFSAIEALPRRSGRLYLDAGGAEMRDVRQMRENLIRKGYRGGKDLWVVEDPLAPHQEAAWARRLPDALRFLLPRPEAAKVPGPTLHIDPSVWSSQRTAVSM